MQTYGQTTTGAQTLKFDIPGKYFVLLATTLGVNIRFYKQGKKLDLGDISNLMAGVEATLGQPDDSEPAFTQVQIDTLGADTIQFGIGNGQVRYNRSQGSVQVTSGNIAISNASAFEQAITAGYASTTPLVAVTPIQVVAPGANANGIIVHDAQILTWTGAANNAALIAKASAPATVLDGNVLLLKGINTAFDPNTGRIAKALKIPAGQGLYFISTNNEVALSFRTCDYTIL